MTSAPEPGLGIELSTTGLQVLPASRDSLIWSRFGGGPLSRIRAINVPSFFLTILGWMLPAPTSGVLVVQVLPQSSVIAINENEKPSEYRGTISLLPSTTNGWARVIQPNRRK